MSHQGWLVPEAPRLIFATRNAGKVAEFQDLLAGLAITLLSLREFAAIPEIPEDASTYRENALAKAEVVCRHLGLPALADDSGLEVDALAGSPGVRSARFAGEPADDQRNIAKLLAALRDVPATARTARFRCTIVVARPDGGVLTADGSCEGLIAPQPAGSGGFGYDPVFLVPALGRTFAELPLSQKHALSHRARACAVLRPRLERFLRGE
ncbi:MAG: XTP/dITP diphosphatase [Deltaproteobacteria bacterium]|nr:XTP/dITP diphosphatase [Deltaproteobacteria bacterium]MBI3389481.1 XTP/dITP diphosphatase [Deltaproteobacteria bacterium]